jgi:hypothetical protein
MLEEAAAAFEKIASNLSPVQQTGDLDSSQIRIIQCRRSHLADRRSGVHSYHGLGLSLILNGEHSPTSET